MNGPKVTLQTTIGTVEGGFGKSTFKNPSALACDYKNNLLVADTDNHRVLKLDAKGNFQWSVGGGVEQDVPRNGTAQGQFNSPQAICTDRDDNIYVADTGNCRVQKFSSEGEFLTIFGSWGRQPGQFGGEGPLGIAVDEKGFVLVSDSHTATGGNHRVQKFDSDGNYVTQFGSYGMGLGQFGGSMPIRQYGFDFGPGIGPGPIGPAGIVVYTDNRHVLEMNTLGGAIFCADCDNDRVNYFYGTGIPVKSLGVGILYRPRQVALDNRGRLYVSGAHHHEPPMEVQYINDPFNWRIEPECRWIWILEPNSGQLMGKLGIPDVHNLMEHRLGAGLHVHGYGLAINPSDDRIVYIQGGNLIFKYQVEWESQGESK